METRFLRRHGVHMAYLVWLDHMRHTIVLVTGARS
jgi:hypothetical protein